MTTDIESKTQMRTILVLANETLGGAQLLKTVKQKASEAETRFFVVVPETKPRHGSIVYTEAVRDAAQLRVDLALAFMREEGIEGSGEVGDRDPFNAAMDAIAQQPIDEIIVSTLPTTSSGWLRRDLIERLEETSGLPIEHVVVDIDSEGLPFDVTLVVANLTVADDELISYLKAKGSEGRSRRFIVVVPQDSGAGHAVKAARDRLGALLESLANGGLVAAGTIGDPDPYTAVMNALQFFRVSDVVISTLPESSSRWLKTRLIERVRHATNVEIDHVVAAQSSTPSVQS